MFEFFLKCCVVSLFLFEVSNAECSCKHMVIVLPFTSILWLTGGVAQQNVELNTVIGLGR